KMKVATSKSNDYREAILTCTAGKDYQHLCQIVKKHKNKTDDFNFDDVVQSFSRKQHESLWSGLFGILSDLREHLTPSLLEDEENINQIEEEDVYSCLEATLVVMAAYMDQEKSIVTEKMVECANHLHEMLMELPDSQDKLRLKIAKLLQVWWVQDFPGKEDIAPNMMVCLITNALQPNAYGRSFLSGLFGLNTKLISKLHTAIKGHLPFSSNFFRKKLEETWKKQVSSSFFHVPGRNRFLPEETEPCRAEVQYYGEIYFKAWKTATGDILMTIEQSCIQDLMFFAVHAKRQGSHSLAAILVQLLGYFTKQKRLQGVDKMLCTLYEPILWRALNAANPGVRVNAAYLLIDAFPLQDPESNKESMDAILQKQIDALNTLLCDPCPTVRVTAVQGVCKVVSVYWELLPAAAVSSFLAKLIQDQVYDTSSPDVRVAVFKGLKYILDNPLSHPLL
ncbi:putative condensin-2 complex subunit G2, partial [Apostichopus japonicus]